jgi:hypothetical protein
MASIDDLAGLISHRRTQLERSFAAEVLRLRATYGAQAVGQATLQQARELEVRDKFSLTNEQQRRQRTFALFDALDSADLDSEDLILAMFHTLDETCPH